jgi:phosphoribosylformimino-5-aminoimidazole carboxamide ribotide isomerase
VQSYAPDGLRHVLCTDIDRDGALLGPNLQLYTEAQRREPTLAWQASGGIRDAADLQALAAIPVAGAISGKALLEDRITAGDLRRWLAA